MLTSNDLKQIGSLIDTKLDIKLKKELSPVRRDIRLIISMFDDDIVNLHRRVERIESHLNLRPL